VNAMVREISDETDRAVRIRGNQKVVYRELIRLEDSHAEEYRPKPLSFVHALLFWIFWFAMSALVVISWFRMLF